MTNNPLIIKFENSNQDPSINNNIVTIPIFTQWDKFVNITEKCVTQKKFNHIQLQFDEIPNSAIRSADIKTMWLLKQATNNNIPVVDVYNDNTYLLNPQITNKLYAPSDAEVLAKKNSYSNWEHHQSEMWKKLATTMPLTKGETRNQTNHHAMLTDKSRGLTDEDLKDFFSWQSNKVIIPSLYADDFVGMPNIKGYVSDKKYNNKPMITLKTTGLQGYVIPMKNPNGDMPKYQVGADISNVNMIIKARTKDGVSIQKSEYYDKRSNTYFFNHNGEKQNINVVYASNDNITLSDKFGKFSVKPKQNIVETLKDRGYEIPDIIDSLKPIPNAKYIWASKGTMIGSSSVSDVVSPSNAGFIIAREPQDSDEYNLLIVEGALKGVITAKYATAKDKNGISMAEQMSKNKGLIIAQVPGVAPAFIESVSRVYDHYKIDKTYVAMDADGRDNLSVARGIHDSEKLLSQYGTVRIVSWDPKLKGIDDALLSVSRHEISLNDMKIKVGDAQSLFPIEQAERPNPYKLDGTRVLKQTWQEEYTESYQKTDDTIRKAQTDTIKYMNKELEDAKKLIGDEDSFVAELQRIRSNIDEILDAYSK